MRLAFRTLAAASAIAALAGILAGCQDKSAADKAAKLEARLHQVETRMEEVRPALGGIMLEIQQHHAKLWYAGLGRNWELAGYELSELREGLDDAVKFNPDFKGIQIATLVPAHTQGPLRSLDAALERKSPRSFAAAYDGLTAACNECHRAAKHPFLRMQRPGPGQFSDQDFRP